MEQEGRCLLQGFSNLNVPCMGLVAIAPNPGISKKLIPDVWLIKSVNVKLALGI